MLKGEQKEEEGTLTMFSGVLNSAQKSHLEDKYSFLLPLYCFLHKFSFLVLVHGSDPCEPEPNLANPFVEVWSGVLKIV